MEFRNKQSYNFTKMNVQALIHWIKSEVLNAINPTRNAICVYIVHAFACHFEHYISVKHFLYHNCNYEIALKIDRNFPDTSFGDNYSDGTRLVAWRVDFWQMHPVLPPTG